MADVTMTIEEYLALIQGMQGMQERMAPVEPTPIQERPRKRKGKKNPKLKRALAEANRRLRTKAKKGSKTKYGPLRKGKTQADVMTLAHRLMKKM